MTHPQIEQMMSHYRNLGEAERRQVERHVRRCDSCAAWLEACRVMDGAMVDFVVQRQSQVKLDGSRVRRPFSIAGLGRRRLLLPQLSALSRTAGRLAGVLLLAAVVAWFALALRNRVSPAAGTTAREPAREVVFVVTPDSGILVLDPSDLVQVGSLPINVTEGPAVGSNGDLYYIADFRNLTVMAVATGRQRVITSVIDPLRTQTRAADRVLAVTPDGRRIVVAHYWTPPEGGVAEEITEFWRTVVDVESGAMLATIPETREHVRTSDTAACLGASMLPAADNRTLYELCLSSMGQGPLLRKLDLEQGAVLSVVRDDALAEAYAAALAPGGQWLYVLTRSGRVAIFNVSDLSLEEIVSLAAGGGPAHIHDYGGRVVFSPEGNLLYLNGRGDPETLYAIDATTWQTVAQARLAEGESVYSLALSSDGSYLYVLSSGSTGGMQLSRWDTTTLSRQAVAIMPGTVYLPANVLAVRLSPVAFEWLFQEGGGAGERGSGGRRNGS